MYANSVKELVIIIIINLSILVCLSTMKPGHLHVTRDRVTRDSYWPSDPVTHPVPGGHVLHRFAVTLPTANNS